MSETFLGDNADPAEGAPIDSPPPAPEPGADPPPAGWIKNLPEDGRGYVENKGWKEPGDILKGYRQLEEFLGADKAGRGFLLPKDEQDREAYEKIYAALGRPEKAEDYELNALLAGEETDPGFITAAGATMHEAGLSKGQARKVAAAYQNYLKATQEAAALVHQREVAEAQRTLSAEDQEFCRRGFRFLGLSNQDAAAIEMYWGVRKAADMFARVGRALGEDTRVDGTAPGGWSGAPEAAKSRRAELMADEGFRKRYLDGEAAAVKQIEDLIKREVEAGK